MIELFVVGATFFAGAFVGAILTRKMHFELLGLSSEEEWDQLKANAFLLRESGR